MKRKMFVTLLMYFAFASALFAVGEKGKKDNGSWFPPECECPDVESFDVACSGTDCPPGEMQVSSSCSGGFGSCLNCIDNAGSGLCCDTQFFEATQSGGCGSAFVNPVAINEEELDRVLLPDCTGTYKFVPARLKRKLIEAQGELHAKLS